MHAAALVDNAEIIRLRAGHGARLEAEWQDRGTPLGIAVRDGRAAAGPALLECGADPAGGKGAEAAGALLFTTLYSGCRTIAEALIAHGADVNAPDGPDGYRAIHAAMFRSEPGLIGMVLAAGADVNGADAAGRTALHWMWGHDRITPLLLAHGADPNTVDLEGDAPLNLAVGAEYPNLSAIELLPADGARASLANRQVEPPLSLPRGAEKVVALLEAHRGP